MKVSLCTPTYTYTAPRRIYQRYKATRLERVLQAGCGATKTHHARSQFAGVYTVLLRTQDTRPAPRSLNWLPVNQGLRTEPAPIQPTWQPTMHCPSCSRVPPSLGHHTAPEQRARDAGPTLAAQGRWRPLHARWLCTRAKCLYSRTPTPLPHSAVRKPAPGLAATPLFASCCFPPPRCSVVGRHHPARPLCGRTEGRACARCVVKTFACL